MLRDALNVDVTSCDDALNVDVTSCDDALNVDVTSCDDALNVDVTSCYNALNVADGQCLERAQQASRATAVDPQVRPFTCSYEPCDQPGATVI